MSVPSISVNRPILANLLMILVIVGGIFSYQQMGQEIFPEMPMEMVNVTTILPGASPKEVEQLLTIPIERELEKIDDIDVMTSTSGDGFSSIVIQFEAGVGDLFQKVTEIQNQIEKVERFPAEAERPSVTEVKASFEIMTLSLVGDAPEREMRDLSRDLRESLRRVPGIDEVTVHGLREREIWVEVDPYRLQSYGLSLRAVSQALRDRNLNLPGGLIRLDRGEFAVRTEAEFTNLDEIFETILLEDRDGGYVRVRDLATVRDTFAETSALARLNGHPSLNITIKKSPDSNALDISTAVRATLDAYESRLPAGSQLVVLKDTSIDIGNRLRALFQNFAVGLMLVALSFTVAIGWRAAIIITAGLPVAFLGSFIFLNAWGYTLNELVIFAMILVLGLIVDDAIVVCENIYRHLEEGMPLKQAAIFGAEQISAPVVATVMTTVAAFLPLLMMGGIVGKFMATIPVVICLALVASLFEAFFILPAHVLEWSGTRPTREAPKPREWVASLSIAYERFISSCLRWRYACVTLVVLAAAGSLIVASKMDFILFGGNDVQSFSVGMEGRPSASLHETDRILREIESDVLAVRTNNPDIRAVRTRAGAMSRGAYNSVSGSHVGQISIELVPEGERRQSGRQTLAEVRENLEFIPGARAIHFEEAEQGPPVGKAVHVQIKGDNFATLEQIADEIATFLSTLDGVHEITDNFPPGKDEVVPAFDLQRLANTQLDVAAIAQEIRGSFEGLEATRIYDGNEEIEVMVKLAPQHRRSLADLAEMQFATPQGPIPFSNVADLVRRQGVSQIQHHNSRRAIEVMAEVDEQVITSQRANRQLMARFSDIADRHPGYTIEYGGEFEDTEESVASLMQAFVIAVVLIYVILGGLFGSFIQPLIVMFSVPFSFIGVVLGFYVLGQPLGMSALIGTLALTGIVVNDSLILIEFINRRRSEGVGVEDSIRRAGSARLRPIILTSITTIAGLLPMSLGLFGVDESLRPMAIAITWGLSFATLLTLVIIPCVYRIFDDISLLLRRRPLAMKRDEEATLALSPPTST